MTIIKDIYPPIKILAYRNQILHEWELEEPVQLVTRVVQHIFQTASWTVVPDRNGLSRVETQAEKKVQVFVVYVTLLKNCTII